MQIAKPCLVGEFLAYLDGPADDPEQQQPAQEETWQPKLYRELQVVVVGPGEEASPTEASISREDVLKRAHPGPGKPEIGDCIEAVPPDERTALLLTRELNGLEAGEKRVNADPKRTHREDDSARREQAS